MRSSSGPGFSDGRFSGRTLFVAASMLQTLTRPSLLTMNGGRLEGRTGTGPRRVLTRIARDGHSPGKQASAGWRAARADVRAAPAAATGHGQPGLRPTDRIRAGRSAPEANMDGPSCPHPAVPSAAVRSLP